VGDMVGGGREEDAGHVGGFKYGVEAKHCTHPVFLLRPTPIRGSAHCRCPSKNGDVTPHIDGDFWYNLAPAFGTPQGRSNITTDDRGVLN